MGRCRGGAGAVSGRCRGGLGGVGNGTVIGSDPAHLQQTIKATGGDRGAERSGLVFENVWHLVIRQGQNVRVTVALASQRLVVVEVVAAGW